MESTDVEKSGQDQKKIELGAELEKEIALLQERNRRKNRILGAVAAVLVILAGTVFAFSRSPNVAAARGPAGFGFNLLASQNGGSVNPNGFGSCCGTAAGLTDGDDQADQADLAQLEQQALVQFKKDTGTSAAKGVATDYGCHIQIDIFDAAGSKTASYGYQGGPLYRIN